MINGLFISDKLQSEFDDNGYAVIPILKEPLLSMLKEYYYNLKIENNTNCLAANIVLAEEQNNEINNFMIEHIRSPLEIFFKNFIMYGASFSIKKNHHPELQLHLDPTNIDEEKDCAYTIWIPIIDVSKENGTMYVIPKSHLFFKSYISYTLPSCLIDRQLILNKYVKTINLKAGEGLIFTSKLLHGSFINSTMQDRPIIILTISNKNAKFVYYNKKNHNTITEYIVDPNDLMNSYGKFSIGELPSNAIFSKDINYNYKEIDCIDLYKKLLKTNNTLVINIIIFIKRIIRWFGNI
jgi:hypothetical protein